MLGPWTVDDVINTTRPQRRDVGRLPAPAYRPFHAGVGKLHLGLAVADMANHTSDEGWQLFLGLRQAGYLLAGHGLEVNDTRVPELLDYAQTWQRSLARVVVLQDKREWDVQPRNFRQQGHAFTGLGCLKANPHTFKLTVLKDAQNNPEYHARSADEIDCHAWVTYYHTRIVSHLAPFTRPGHLVRTTHSLDPALVPPYQSAGRKGCLLSGALSDAYPLRRRLAAAMGRAHELDVLPHPGYHRLGCRTGAYLETLSRYKVAICTASRYGYALRKIIEATAAGCVVVSDLPVDDVLPEIDGNVLRVHPQSPIEDINKVLRRLDADYDPARQEWYASRAVAYYDYRAAGQRLAQSIEHLRMTYATAGAD